jgi:transposase
MLRVDQVHVIRHKVLVEGRSQRQVAKEFAISRVTVRKYLEKSVPVRKETGPRTRPVWEQVAPRIEALLAESGRWTAGKQQLTATRLHELLVGEGHRVGVTLVKEAVAEWKRQRREVFVPLTYRPGDLAEVDFFEVYVDVAGRRQKAWLFLMRLMYSGRDFAWIYERQDQVSFLDGHVRAFAHFAGVPTRLAYDNFCNGSSGDRSLGPEAPPREITKTGGIARHKARVFVRSSAPAATPQAEREAKCSDHSMLIVEIG